MGYSSGRTIAFWVFWITSNLGLFIYGWLKQMLDPELANLNVLRWSVWISRGAGLVLAYNATVLILPMCRNLVRVLRGTWLNNFISFDESIFFHKQGAFSLLFFTLLHTNAHYVNFFNLQITFRLFPTEFLHYQHPGGVTGHIMILCMFLMYTASHPAIRKQSFELFWYVHHLFFVFYICLLFHAVGCFVRTSTGKCKGYFSWPYTLVAFGIYLFERYNRYRRSLQRTSLSHVILHPSNTLELRFEKSALRYKPGQYLFLNLPEVSQWQWHPLTITSAPEDGYTSVHIRLVGDWTNDVARRLGAIPAYGKNGLLELESKPISTVSLPRLCIDGPYGAPAQDYFKEEVAVMVAGGIGVTPFASLLKSMWYKFYRKVPMRLKKAYFIWVNRETEAICWFHQLLETIESSVVTDMLEIQVYLTQSMKPNDIHNIMINTNEDLDPLTNLQTLTHYGRPNFTQILNKVKLDVKTKIKVENPEHCRVGVFFCGPFGLGESVIENCRSSSDESIKFEFFEEHF